MINFLLKAPISFSIMQKFPPFVSTKLKSIFHLYVNSLDLCLTCLRVFKKKKNPFFCLSRVAFLWLFQSMGKSGLRFLIFYEGIDNSISFGIKKDCSHAHTYANKLNLVGKSNPHGFVHLGVCLHLSAFEFLTPSLYFYKSQKEVIFKYLLL